MAILYTVSGIVGSLFFGHLSQRFGRLYAIMLALAIGLLSIRAWAFGMSLGVLLAGVDCDAIRSAGFDGRGSRTSE